MKKKENNLIRIGQMAKKAGVSAPTIKHYVNEGLLPAPVKTSKNMAYYDESCVERIKLIKKLQKEKFLPLDVIKRIIDSGEAIDEDMAMGKAILKSHKIPTQSKLIKESQIVKRTGYPLEKIRLLEKEELIQPGISENGKVYDEADCQIIELIKRREEIGVRFDYSIQVFRVYRDAIKQAVAKDTSIFAMDLVGDIPTQKAIRLMTEADETLTDFMVCYRQKMSKITGEVAIRQINQLPNSLKFLNFFPVEGNELPKTPPKDLLLKCFYYFCKGDFKKARDTIAKRTLTSSDYDAINISILADIFSGNIKHAGSKVTKYLSKPSAYVLNNAVAALTYLFSISAAGGFSEPMLNIKKTLGYLKRIEKSNERHVFSLDFARYICGAVYTMLPEAVNLYQEGVDILSQLDWTVTRKKLEETTFPEWLIRTIDYEILPAIEIRINRFLAEGYRNLGQNEHALLHLNELLAISDPDSDMAEWAGMQRIHITK
ncbi:MAG: MerR family transcriptional regulator [Proteobacteria bacterium]|nr:MerR family transcriptional regulator [Pseudomonadota bacterium]